MVLGFRVFGFRIWGSRVPIPKHFLYPESPCPWIKEYMYYIFYRKCLAF